MSRRCDIECDAPRPFGERQDTSTQFSELTGRQRMDHPFLVNSSKRRVCACAHGLSGLTARPLATRPRDDGAVPFPFTCVRIHFMHSCLRSLERAYKTTTFIRVSSPTYGRYTKLRCPNTEWDFLTPTCQMLGLTLVLPESAHPWTPGT